MVAQEYKEINGKLLPIFKKTRKKKRRRKEKKKSKSPLPPPAPGAPIKRVCTCCKLAKTGRHFARKGRYAVSGKPKLDSVCRDCKKERNKRNYDPHKHHKDEDGVWLNSPEKQRQRRKTRRTGLDNYKLLQLGE